MSRRRTISTPQTVQHINVVPLLDVLFAVLTFFIMSSLLMTKLETMPVNLPKAKNSQPQKSAKVSLTINQKGEIFLNRKAVEATQVVDALKQLQSPDQPLTVVLNADQAINYGNAVKVLDQVRQVPGVKIAISTKQPSANP